MILNKKTPFILVITFFAWLAPFLHPVFNQKPFISDAGVFFTDINNFFAHISSHVFPLWTHYFGGIPNEFYLRRIGEFNPLLYMPLILSWTGVPITIAYRICVFFYYFLGLVGFYLLAKRLFQNTLLALVAYWLLLFSSLGTKTIDSYIILLFTPAVWFFYFLIAFAQNPRKIFLLGLTFTLMIILTTYLPFYFLTVLLIFSGLFVSIHPFDLPETGKNFLSFAKAHKIFTGVCVLLVIVSAIPGYLWLQSTGSGNITMPYRNASSPIPNAMGISVQSISAGGIAPPLVFHELFSNLQDFTQLVFFIPLFAFIVLLLSAIAPVTKRIVLLLSWAFIILLVALTDLTPIHPFLFRHIFYFKLFRNLGYFLWLAILPIFILFIVDQLRSLLGYNPETRRERGAFLFWISLAHAAFFIFLINQHNVILSSYAVLILSFIFFTLHGLGHLRGRRTISLIFLFFIVAIQPLEVYLNFHNNYTKSTDTSQQLFRVPSDKARLYVGMRWTSQLMDQIDANTWIAYTQKRFLAYDRVEQITNENEILEKIEQTFSENQNIAFVIMPKTAHPLTVPLSRYNSHPETLVETPGRFEILRFNVNEVKLRTNFETPKFLVYNDSFHENWHAFINNKPAQLFRANIAFKGLWVPQGKNIVYLRFGTAKDYLLKLVLFFTFFTTFFYLIGLGIKYCLETFNAASNHRHQEEIG